MPVSYSYGSVIADWEEQLKRYKQAEAAADKEFRTHSTLKNKYAYKNRKAIRIAMTRVIHILHRSVYEANQQDANPVMIFRDKLTIDTPNLERIVKDHGTETSHADLIGECSKIIEQLDESYTSPYNDRHK